MGRTVLVFGALAPLAWMCAFGCLPEPEEPDLDDVGTLGGDSPVRTTGEVRKVVGADGGIIEVTRGDSVTLAGTVLDIPAGALAADTEITIVAASADVAADGVASVGPAVAITPSSTSFSADASLTLPFDNISTEVVVAWQHHDGTVVVISGDALVTNTALKRVSLAVGGLGTFQAKAP